MTTHLASSPRRLAIVLGCGDVGSAVALGLHRAGFAVALADEADPAWPRRGMALTDAWYFGNAELDGEEACFCASIKSIPSVLGRRMIAATTWSWQGVATAIAPALLVDARAEKRRRSRLPCGALPLSIGIGAGFVGGENVDIAIGISTPSSGRPGIRVAESADLAAMGPDDRGTRAVSALRHGRFMTERRIGDTVRAGQVIGGLGNEVIAAPADGVLLGLAARGSRIEPGDALVEVDPGGVAERCFGVTADARRIATAVLDALGDHRNPDLRAALDARSVADQSLAI